MNLEGLNARINRLDELPRGLAEELNRWKNREHPLLPQERADYFQQVRRAKDGMERARAMLLRAVYRLAVQQTVRYAPKTP
jgi:hypothetical protein